jgi:hypothetical protein
MTSTPRAVTPSILGVLALGLAVIAVAFSVAAQGGGAAAVDRPAPEIAGGPWINSQPLASAALRGRVVFVEFWTYG